MQRKYLPDWLVIVLCCFAVLALLAFGIWHFLILTLVNALGDGMVAVDGWVVEASPGGTSDVTMHEKKIEPPQGGTIGNAWVELWTGDGRRLLRRYKPEWGEDGSFEIGDIGKYEPGMRYRIRAGASGYQPVEGQVPKVV